MTFESRHIAQAIQRTPADVVAFAGDPANLPRWAGGLSSGIRNEDGRWFTDSPMGVVEVRFAGGGEFGVLDHDVIFPDGTLAHNPLRVLHNDNGAEVVFTLYRRPNVADEEYEHDAALVAADLTRLREIVEAARWRL